MITLTSRSLRGLKDRVRGSDRQLMASPVLECPICDAELVLAGDERPGDPVMCSFCGSPFIVTRLAVSGEDTTMEIEEDF
jgi:hypothetical protein